jgi:hypothetical protein
MSGAMRPGQTCQQPSNVRLCGRPTLKHNDLPLDFLRTARLKMEGLRTKLVRAAAFAQKIVPIPRPNAK